MSEIILLLKALAALAWPLCLLAIINIFKNEIKLYISSKLCKEHRIVPPASKIELSEIVSSTPDTTDKTLTTIDPSINILPIEEKTESPNINFTCYLSVCKNIKTGKYYIILNDDDNSDKMLLITPQCKLKLLNKHLFNDTEYIDEHILKENGAITNKQLNKYYQYIDTNEDAARLTEEDLTICKINGSEPEYIINYRRMLHKPNTMPSIMFNIVKEHGKIKWKDLTEKLTSEYKYLGTGGSFDASLRVLYVDGHISVNGDGENKYVQLISSDNYTDY